MASELVGVAKPCLYWVGKGGEVIFLKLGESDCIEWCLVGGRIECIAHQMHCGQER